MKLAVVLISVVCVVLLLTALYYRKKSRILMNDLEIMLAKCITLERKYKNKKLDVPEDKIADVINNEEKVGTLIGENEALKKLTERQNEVICQLLKESNMRKAKK